jgi:2-methylcitrate dehydratase PrpD
MVEIERMDGSATTVRCDHPKGSSENPVPRAEVEAKFRIYAKARISENHVERVLELVSRLEELKSTRKLMDLLRSV